MKKLTSVHDEYDVRERLRKTRLNLNAHINLAAALMEPKPWVGLTDEEVGGLTVFDGLFNVETPLLAEYIRHIESKLKEKNGG
jgi:hypothetical protein